MKRKVYACDKLTMRVVEEYATATEAAEAGDRDVTNLHRSAKRKTVGGGRIVYRFADDYDPGETFEGKRNRPVVVTDVDSKRSAAFYRKADAAKRLFVSVEAIDAALRDGHLIDGRFAVKHAR